MSGFRLASFRTPCVVATQTTREPNGRIKLSRSWIRGAYCHISPPSLLLVASAHA
jgi:hypothetical protein